MLPGPSGAISGQTVPTGAHVVESTLAETSLSVVVGLGWLLRAADFTLVALERRRSRVPTSSLPTNEAECGEVGTREGTPPLLVLTPP